MAGARGVLNGGDVAQFPDCVRWGATENGGRDGTEEVRSLQANWVVRRPALAARQAKRDAISAAATECVFSEDNRGRGFGGLRSGHRGSFQVRTGVFRHFRPWRGASQGGGRLRPFGGTGASKIGCNHGNGAVSRHISRIGALSGHPRAIRHFGAGLPRPRTRHGRHEVDRGLPAGSTDYHRCGRSSASSLVSLLSVSLSSAKSQESVFTVAGGSAMA